jgi:hypothetical protein
MDIEIAAALNPMIELPWPFRRRQRNADWKGQPGKKRALPLAE